jgi:hypothetical protein
VIRQRLPSGCKSRPANSVAPAGSYRSGGGGNKAVGAFETNVPLGGAASRQAVTRVNAEQASKDLTWEPTRLLIGEGRRRWRKRETGGIGRPKSDLTQRSHRGNGNGMSTHGRRLQHGKPLSAEARDLQPDAREGQAGLGGVADRPAVPTKPMNAGGGKGPEFKTDVRKGTRTRRLA